MPMRAGTGEQGVFEHVDRRAELLPEGGSPQWIAHMPDSFRISRIRSVAVVRNFPLLVRSHEQCSVPASLDNCEATASSYIVSTASISAQLAVQQPILL